MFTAIGALINANKPADVITCLNSCKPGQSAGSRRLGLYLNALAQYVPSAGQHPPLCRDRARARHPAQTGQRQRRDFHQRLQPQGKKVERILDEAEQRSSTSARRARAWQGFQSLDTLVINLLDRVQEMADNPNDVTGVPPVSPIWTA